MTKENVRWKNVKNKKTMILAFFLAIAVVIAGVGFSTVRVNAGDIYTTWQELSELDGVETNTSITVALNGNYKVTENTTIEATASGVSAITIKGETHLYIADGVTLTVTGANGDGTVGGGAGICLPSGKTLHIHGEGTLVATGGNSGSATPGSPASNAEFKDETLTTGAGGDGGNGAGSAGAGIGGSGVKGGNGGDGGESQNASKTVNSNGINGTNGQSGAKGNAMGTLYLYDTLTIQATAGTSNNATINAGINGNSSSGTEDSMSYMAFTSAGGGAGGNAGISANIGGSGAGGNGGGGGASGGYIIAEESVQITQQLATTAGSSSYGENQTAGGAGGNSGSGSYTKEEQTVSSTGGTGGSGGSVSTGGAGGTVYCSSGVTLQNELSGGINEFEGKAATPHTLHMLTAKAYYYDEEQQTYIEGPNGGTVASGVHKPGASVTANTNEESKAQVSAEPAEGYSFAGWYSDVERVNLLSGELDYTVDFSEIQSEEQIVYALFKKATQITAENGTLTVYKGITEEKQDGLSKLVIPRDTVVTINGSRKTLKQGGVYYYKELVTTTNTINGSAGLSTYPGEELLFYSKPAENYFYSGMTIDNEYKSAREFAQYSFVTVGEEFPKTYTSLFSSAKTLTLNFEGGVEVDYNGPIKFDMADMEYKLPQTIRIGYNFLGWKLNSEDFTDYIPAGSIVRYKEDSENKNNMQLAVYTYNENGVENCVYTAPAEDGIGFSAQWDTKIYPITLVMPDNVTIEQFEGVEMVEGVYNYTYNEDENAMIQLPTAEDMVYAGHDFLGWYLYEDYSGKSVTEFSSHSTNAPTFYAKWGKQFQATLTLEGAPIVGQTLSAMADSEDKNITFTYAWYRDGVQIAGKTEASYTLCPEDEGCVIKCIATGSGDYTPNMSISCSTEKISIKTGNTLTGLTISGIAQNGKTLTASILPTTAENVTYQWYRLTTNTDESGTLVETAIDGATSSTYKLTQQDVGFALKCIAMDGYGKCCSFTTPVISETSTVKLVVTEQAKVACGSGTSIKVDTQDMTANSYITITIPKGLELVKYPDEKDRTIGAFITSVEKIDNKEDGTVTLTYYFEKKTNVLGFSITVKPDYTNTHGSVKQIKTAYTNTSDVSIVGETTIHITNVTAQPGSGYIYPVTDKEVYYQVRDKIFHIYNPALFVNTTVTSAHPSYKEVSMVVPISSSKYIPIPVFYDEDDKTSKELIDGQTYQMKDGDEEYTVTYYENYAVKNGTAEKATYTGPVLVYTLPEKSGICTGASSEYRFNGEYTDGSKLALKFNKPEPGKYLPEYKEQINIKDDNGAKTTVYNTGSRSNHTSLEIIFYEEGTDSLYLSTDITSLGYSHMVNNILVPYKYSNRYSAYLTYYSKENLITDMNIHYNLEEQNANNNSTLGCNEVTFCYPNTFKKGTTYQATITFEDGSSKTTSVYNSQQTFKSTNGKQIIAVDVHYKNEADNGGILRGASAELLYCNIYNEQNSQSEAEGKITATITEITYVGEASNQQVEKKENVRTHSIAYHFQHTDTFTAAVPTINPSAIEIGDTITIQYTFGNGTTPGATYSPETYMIMPKGYIYQEGSYQKNANSSYKASSVTSENISSLYTTDGVFKESTNQLLETGYATDGSKMYEIFGRSMEINGSYYNVYSILYYDKTIRSGYKTLGMDFMVGDYISMPEKNSDGKVTLPYAIYFDNGETVYQTEKNSAFIASYEKDSNTYYISENSVGYDINGDNDKLDSFAKPSAMPKAALNVSYVMVIDGKTDKEFYKVNEEGHYTAVIFNRTSDNTGQAEITIDLARNKDAGSEFNMILLGPVTLKGGDIGELNGNEYVKYCIPDADGTPQYYTQTEIENNSEDALSYDKVTQLKITCGNLSTGNLNTISFDFTPKNIVTGQDEIAGAYVPTSVSYTNSSTEPGSESYKTTVPCEIEAARLKLTGISMEESTSDKGKDIYYVGEKLTATNPKSELSEKNQAEKDDQATFTYQWYRDGNPIPGETDETYTLTNEDYGHTVYCMITGTEDYYNSVKTPAVNKIAVDLKEETPYDANITISGKTVLNNKAADRTLTANLSTTEYPSNIAVTYQWYRSEIGENGTIEWTEIEGATSKTYTLTNEDWGKQLTVKAFGKGEKYAYVETGYSNPVGPITTRKTYVYVKQDGKLSEAKGTITLVNKTNEELTYELRKTSNGTYCFENMQPGKYKVLADDSGYPPNETDTKLTVSVGTDISSQSTTINYYSIKYELIDEKAVIAGEKVTDYPIYYRKNQGVTLPTEVSLTNEDYGEDEFLGWYLDDHYTSSKQTAVKGTENKAMTYYAKWKYTHPIFYQLKNVTASNMQNTIWDKTTYSTTLTAIDKYYEITEDTIEVKVDGRILESNEYKYTKNTGTQQDSGTLEILSDNVTGVIDIIVFAEAKKFSITRDLEHITSNKSDVKEIKYGTNYTETLTVDAGYTIPSEITVMRGKEILDPSKYTVTMSGRNIKVTIPGTEITDDIEIIAKAVKVGAESHKLTIEYVYENGEHLEGIDTVVKTLEEGDSYSVASPSVDGFVPDLSRVSGTMDTVDVTVTVVYRPENKANLPENSPKDEQTGEDDKWVSDTEEDYKDATTNILVTVKHQDEGTLVEGITTYAYQILSIQTRNEGGYKYAINTYYQDFFNTLLGKDTASDKDVLDYLETLTTNEKINAFLEKIQEYTLEEENKVSYVAKETGKPGSTQFTLDCSRRYSEEDESYYAGMGYYFFVSEGTLGDQMTLSLVKRDMTVYIKSQEVTLEKEVEKPDYPMNSNTIPYTITVPVPNMTNVLPGYTYKVHDIIDNGITIDKDSLKVYVYERFYEENAIELIVEDDYQVAYGTEDEKEALTITFHFDSGNKLKDNQQNGKLIKIVYTASLNKGAVLGGNGNQNIAYLEYSRNPYSDITKLEKTEEDKETVYTYGIDIIKKSGALFSAPVLPGAEFTIKELTNSGAEILSFKNNGGKYYKSDDGIKTMVTDADGMLQLYGLDAGIYMIEETKAPEGYQTIDPFYLEIRAEYNEEGILKSFSGKLTDTKGFVNITKTSKEKGILSLKIVDPTEGTNELPATGGIGRIIIYCLGGTFMVGAILLLTLRAKKKEDEDEE